MLPVLCAQVREAKLALPLSPITPRAPVTGGEETTYLSWWGEKITIPSTLVSPGRASYLNLKLLFSFCQLPLANISTSVNKEELALPLSPITPRAPVTGGEETTYLSCIRATCPLSSPSPSCVPQVNTRVRALKKSRGRYHR